jgi:Fe-S oxidoreductase
MVRLKKGKDAPKDMKLYDDEDQEAHVWEVREAGLGATAFIPGKPDTYEGWEDSAVPPERLGMYLRDLRKLAGKYGYQSALYGHYGNGCVHARWNFDLKSDPGIKAFRSFLDQAADLVVSHGGSISGEHGDGQSNRQVPPHGWRRHVPQLHGHTRGEAHDPRPGPGAFRDAERRGDRRLPLGRSARSARSLPLVQGLTNDCPVSVDMPTLKAEFLSHHYRGRLRPRPAYAFGLIEQASRLASKLPAVVNFFTQTPPFDRAFKLAAGIHPKRKIPPFAAVTLKDWFAVRPSPNDGGRRVILWANTFTNYLEPEVGIAAVEALEDASFDVVIPTGHLCSGRPLHDYGMLDQAEAYLRNVLDRLREDIHAGTPVVGIEPSCVAVFKDELCKLLPHDEDARRLAKQTFHLGEFLARAPGEPPRRTGKALLHGHCHQLATGGVTGTREVLERTGLEVELLDSGCCGMAGSWGYERQHYDVSIACGERVLFPAVRDEDSRTLVVADGFSCRNQIEAGTGRKALHLAQVLAGKEAA